MALYRSFEGVSDVRDATVTAILEQAPASITPGELADIAFTAYRIVLTLEDAASRIYTHTARRGCRMDP